MYNVQGGPGKSGVSSRLHTTEEPPALVSVLEANDLTEMMSMVGLYVNVPLSLPVIVKDYKDVT